MKKIKQRKGTVALMVAAATLFYLGGHFVWEGMTHHGSGVWTFGGDEPGTGDNLGTDEYKDVIPETEYKRQCYVNAGMFFVFGGIILAGAIKAWKERNELEKSWERTLSNPGSLQEVRQRPELYRDDFKKWINENHPNLKIWTLPPFRIVMVNDEPTMLEMFGVVIRSSFKNVSVSGFGNAHAALQEITQRNPDLLITDDTMPAMTGEELCRILLERQVKYPIIAVSPWTPTEEWVREFSGRGLNISYLCVPCDGENILKAVETALKIRRDFISGDKTRP